MQGKTCCVMGHRDIPAEQIGHIKKSLEREADRVITVYDGREKGGTVGTIRLAHTMKKELREIAIGELNVSQHLMHFK